MTRDEASVRYSAADLRALRERGESKTDVARVCAKTEEALERDLRPTPIGRRFREIGGRAQN